MIYKMYKLIYKSNFEKSLKNLKKWNIKIFSKVWKILEILYDWPPFEEIYNVHELSWDYKWFFSVNVTWDYRIIFTINKIEKEIVLYFILNSQRIILKTWFFKFFLYKWWNNF